MFLTVFRSIDRRRHFHFPLSLSRRRFHARRKSFSRKHSWLERALRTSRGSITDDGSTPKSSSPTHASNPFLRTRLAARRDAKWPSVLRFHSIFLSDEREKWSGSRRRRKERPKALKTRPRWKAVSKRLPCSCLPSPGSLLLSPFSSYQNRTKARE